MPADETTGQAVCAFVILRGDAVDEGEATIQALRNHVAKEIGPIAKPRQIMIVPELPKTRSGKIMRRLLKDVAEGREIGDVDDAGRLLGHEPDRPGHDERRFVPST